MREREGSRSVKLSCSRLFLPSTCETGLSPHHQSGPPTSRHLTSWSCRYETPFWSWCRVYILKRKKILRLFQHCSFIFYPISFTFSTNEVCLKIKDIKEWKECEWYWLPVAWVLGEKRSLFNCRPDLMQHTSDSEIDAEYDNQFLVTRHPSNSPKRLPHMSKCCCILLRCSFNNVA